MLTALKNRSFANEVGKLEVVGRSDHRQKGDFWLPDGKIWLSDSGLSDCLDSAETMPSVPSQAKSLAVASEGTFGGGTFSWSGCGAASPGITAHHGQNNANK